MNLNRFIAVSLFAFGFAQNASGSELASYFSGLITVSSHTYTVMARDEWEASESAFTAFFKREVYNQGTGAYTKLAWCSVNFRKFPTPVVENDTARWFKKFEGLYNIDRKQIVEWQANRPYGPISEEWIAHSNTEIIKRYLGTKEDAKGRFFYYQLTEIFFFKDGRIYTGEKDCKSEPMSVGDKQIFLDTAHELVVHLEI